MWEAMTLLIQPAVISLPMPTPGRAVSFATIVNLLAPFATRASIMRSGDPTPMNPPIITTAPSGTRSAAAAGDRDVLILPRLGLRLDGRNEHNCRARIQGR